MKFLSTSSSVAIATIATVVSTIGVYAQFPGGGGLPPSGTLVVYTDQGDKTWADAEAFCQSTHSAHLATIVDANAQAYLMAAASGAIIWVGLNDQTTEGTFVWASGSTSVYYSSQWAIGEPTTDTSKNCVVLDNSNIYTAACSDGHSFACDLTTTFTSGPTSATSGPTPVTSAPGVSSDAPSSSPTKTKKPSKAPVTFSPTTQVPSNVPTTGKPTTGTPTKDPTTGAPTKDPTTGTPTVTPTTASPTTATPTKDPTTRTPTTVPTTRTPSVSPTLPPNKKVTLTLITTAGKMTWDEATEYCIKTYNTTLATVRTPADQAVLDALSTQVWIGLNDIDVESNNDKSKFVWASGEPYNSSVSYWTNGKDPNGVRTENCVANYGLNLYHWADDYCGNKYFFACDTKGAITTTRSGQTAAPTTASANPNASIGIVSAIFMIIFSVLMM